MSENVVSCRTSGCDDNVCQTIMPNEDNTGCECTNCNGCADENNFFRIHDYGGDYFTVEYYRKIGDLVIDAYSERIDKKALMQT